jgi:signal transduction histidine kinase
VKLLIPYSDLISERFANISLSRKSLLATIIPFLINLAWLVVMWANSVHIQDLANKEKQQSLLLQELNEVSQEYYDIQSTFLSAVLDKNAYEVKRFEYERADFNAMVDKLLTNPAFTPNQLEILHQLQKFSDLQEKLLSENGNDSTEDKWTRFVKLRNKFLSMLNSRFQFRTEYKKFLLPQRIELDRLQKRQKSQSQVFLILLIAGVTGNLVMVIVVHFLFSRYITEKISTLVANARDLSKKKKLPPTLPGLDDFAFVDAALHQSEKEITAATTHRQDLMQMLAHDLRSPLASSQVSLEGLLSREATNLNQNSTEVINKISSNNKRLLSHISDLLTIDALELGQLELFINPEQLNICVDEAIETLSGLALAKSVRLRSTVTPKIAMFDNRRIVQVLVNLLSNAIKFSAADSEIVVDCAPNLKGGLLVRVIDHGKGISERDQKKLFQKYSQAEDGREASGSGLGLAICKLIVDAHGEAIGVTSAPGKGSAFWFTLSEPELDDDAP